MAPARIAIVAGQRFGQLTISGEPIPTGKRWRYPCRCDCGGTALVRKDSLLRGATTFCPAKTHYLRTHGMFGTVEYAAWAAMIGRCTNATNLSFRNYGGRGITVCDAWRDFSVFYADMGPRPSNRHSIERINNDAGYDKENCRWATVKEQARNRRTIVPVTAFGRTAPISEWSEEFGVKHSAIRQRLRRGWPPELAVTRQSIRAGAGENVLRPGPRKQRGASP